MLQASCDLAYVREVRPQFGGLDDEACLAAWRDEPSSAGPRTPRDHLLALGLELESYPPTFPWQLYARIAPVAGAHRWAALDHFCEEGFPSGIRLPFREDDKPFLIALARGYAGRRDRSAIEAFELAAVIGPLSSGERQHLADSYLREQLWRPARRIYESLIGDDPTSDGEVTAWTVRNCVLASLALGDWDHAARTLDASRAVMGEDPIWRSTATDLLERSFAAGLQAARARYAAGESGHGDALVETTVSRTWTRMVRLEAPPPLARGSGEVVVVANCDDPVSRRARIDTKGALFGSLGVPWRLIPMGDLAAGRLLPSTASAVVFFNVPATLEPLRVLFAARAAGLGTIFEADAPVFDPSCMPAPIDTYDGLLAPSLHDELRLACALYRALAARCDVGIAAAPLTAAKLAALVRSSASFVLANSIDQSAVVGHDPGAVRVLFLHSPRFLAVTVEPGSLGTALIEALRGDPSLRFTVAGHVRLAEAFNDHDDRIDDLGADASEVALGAALGSAILNIAPQAVRDDDGLADLSWLQAARYGVATALDGRVAEALGLVDGRTCLAVDGDGWARALGECLRDLPGLSSIGNRARSHALIIRASAARADQLAGALATVAEPLHPTTMDHALDNG